VAGLVASKPEKLFRQFRSHVAAVLNRTVTDCRVSLLLVGQDRAKISTGVAEDPVAGPLRKPGLYLYVGQDLQAVRETKKKWRLRTIQYAYRIQAGPTFDADWFLRFEYKSREVASSQHPRHHLHLPGTMKIGNSSIDLAHAHIPTGWVTIEELVRFLIDSLKVRPKRDDWDTFLQESEEKFREWTDRSI